MKKFSTAFKRYMKIGTLILGIAFDVAILEVFVLSHLLIVLKVLALWHT